MYKDLFNTLAAEGVYYDTATEAVDGNKRNFFQKICDAVLWFLRKVKEIVLKIIAAIKRFFTGKGTSSRTEIAAAIRQYRTEMSNIEKANSEVVAVSQIPGLDGFNGKPENPTTPPTEGQVQQGEKVLEASLNNALKIYEPQLKSVIDLMGKILHLDDTIMQSQTQFVLSVKDMTPQLISTEVIPDNSIKHIDNLKEDIEKISNDSNTMIEKFLSTTKEDKKQIAATITTPISELHPTCAMHVRDIFSRTIASLISSLKKEAPNFQQYLQKIESHAETYKKSAEQLTTIITDIKNHVKIGHELNTKTDTVLQCVQSVSKANMMLNNAFIKVMNIAKIQTL